MNMPLHAGSDWNTCAQAAVVDVLLALRRMPRAAPGRDGAASWRRALVERIAERHPPDAPLGLGTSAFRLRAALRDAGLAARLVHGGWFGWRRARALAAVADHVQAGLPALVCVDAGALGGAPWAAHWTRLVALDATRARLADGDAAYEVPRARFVAAWRCRHLPWPHAYCAILAEPAPR